MHIHPYERRWIIFSFGLLTVFGLAIIVSNMFLGINVPGIADQVQTVISPAEAAAVPTGLRELGPGRYEVHMTAQVWRYEPNEVRIPKDSTVTFYLYSKDIIHGFKIPGTTLSSMIIPGQVGKMTYTFTEPGEYPIICHEYCGAGHHLMTGRVIVE